MRRLALTLATIRDRIGRHSANRAGGSGFTRAAVAIVLREGAQGPELLTIHRSERPGDPWSGHMALPGGREEGADGDLFVTATRETHEEVGIDLRRDGELFGNLDDLQAVGGGQPLNLIIRPFVCSLKGPVTLSLNYREVQSVLWVPLRQLLHESTKGVVVYEIEGRRSEHAAFVYRGHQIWGLTYRIVSQLLELIQ